jgi:hypothetical protein
MPDKRMKARRENLIDAPSNFTDAAAKDKLDLDSGPK